MLREHGDFRLGYRNRLDVELSRIGSRRINVYQRLGPDGKVVHPAVKVPARSPTAQVADGGAHVFDVVGEGIVAAPIQTVDLNNGRVVEHHDRDSLPDAGRQRIGRPHHLLDAVDLDPERELALTVARRKPAHVAVGVRELKNALTVGPAVPFYVNDKRAVDRCGHARVQIDKLIHPIKVQHGPAVVGCVRGPVDQPSPGHAVGIPHAITVLPFELILQEEPGEILVRLAILDVVAPSPQELVACGVLAVLDVVAVNNGVAVYRAADFGVSFTNSIVINIHAMNIGMFQNTGITINTTAPVNNSVVTN